MSLFTPKRFRSFDLFKRFCNTSVIESKPRIFDKFLTISLVGKPNVGKSTIFNRFCKREGSIVSAFPGTTRDRKSGIGMIGGLEFKLIDTGGFDDDGSFGFQIQEQVKRAISQSDIVLFVVDGKNGLTSVDIDCAKWLRVVAGGMPSISEHPREVLLVR